MIKNGRPYSDENGYIDNGLITDHDQMIQEIVFDWIRKNIRARKTPNYRHTSYGLKHNLQHDTSIYLSNNEFKDAMLECGFTPVDPDELNWSYGISEKSPVFKCYSSGYRLDTDADGTRWTVFSAERCNGYRVRSIDLDASYKHAEVKRAARTDGHQFIGDKEGR